MLLPPYEIAKQIAAGGKKTYDTSSLSDVIRDREGAIPNTESDRNLRDVLEQLLGIGTFPMDVGGYQRRLRESEGRARRTYARRRGYQRQFS